MKGGMSRRQGGPNLAERSALSRTGSPAAEGGRAASKMAGRPVAGRHCWVHAAPLSPGDRTAALLVQWRQGDDGLWLGRVVYAVESSEVTAQPIVVDAWMPSSLLEPG